MDNNLNPAYYPGESRGTISQSALNRGGGRIVIPVEDANIGTLNSKPTLSNAPFRYEHYVNNYSNWSYVSQFITGLLFIILMCIILKIIFENLPIYN